MTAPPVGDRVVSVLLPLAAVGPYDYRLPAALGGRDGSFVRAPLGPRRAVGVVWGAASGGAPAARLRDIEAVLDVPPMADSLRAFVDWVAEYGLNPRGAVLRMAMSVAAALEPPRPARVLVRGDAAPARLSPQRAAVLAALESGAGAAESQAALARRAGVGAGVVRGLVAAGVLRIVERPGGEAAGALGERAAPGGAARPLLSPAQATAAAALRGAVGGGFSATLLDGVTGSGKTEVYFEAVAAALEAGRQALVLLPEIALGAQWLERFERRFRVRPAVWHSNLPAGRRRDVWRAVARGAARVVVGARSALFLPFPALGAIVVDEEHDASYKQEDGAVYNARDMAVVRARLAGIPVVLSSATPSLETLHNVAGGRYRAVRLPSRHGGAAPPRIDAVDLRADPPPRGRFVSPRLASALAETLDAGEQAMLFLNRRGYAPLTLCRACGHRLECPNCAAWLVEHRLAGELRCHHCDLRRPTPRRCPECGAEDALVACGPGVERLAEEVEALFPGKRYETMTSDTLRAPGAAAAAVAAVAERRIDLIVGTQIVAKGHHFPGLTLVGAVDADLGLAGGDLRAAERTFQLLLQACGRAGRGERPGRALLQTHAPDHPVIRALVSGDRDRFVAAETAARRAAGMPPFGRLAAVVVSGRDAAAARAAAVEIARAAPRAPGLSVLGPAPAPLALLRGRYRFRLLVRGPQGRALNARLAPWLAPWLKPSRGGVRVRVDVDPYSFL